MVNLLKVSHICPMWRCLANIIVIVSSYILNLLRLPLWFVLSKDVYPISGQQRMCLFMLLKHSLLQKLRILKCIIVKGKIKQRFISAVSYVLHGCNC